MTVSLSDDDDAVQDAAVTLTHTVTGADEYENPPSGQEFTVSPRLGDAQGERRAGSDGRIRLH